MDEKWGERKEGKKEEKEKEKEERGKRKGEKGIPIKTKKRGLPRYEGLASGDVWMPWMVDPPAGTAGGYGWTGKNAVDDG